MLLELRKLNVPPGHQLLLKELSWQEFEAILQELGESRSARLSYSNGTLEIMTPLMGHETAKVLIGDLVKILLDQQGSDYEPTGSTTFKSEQMDQGVEPDESFYITHCQVIRGRQRIDLTVDPPPDLAIEIDLTSRTRFENYQRLGVPELWRYDGKRLQINVLQNGNYVEVATSPTFPGLALPEKIVRVIAQSQTTHRSTLLREFRQWVTNQSPRSS